jgi:hypothetical protein
MNGESLWSRLAGLALVVETYGAGMAPRPEPAGLRWAKWWSRR